MNSSSHSSELDEALDVLDKKGWRPVLDELIRNYEGAPDEIQKQVKEQLTDALLDMAAFHARKPKVSITRMIARRISEMDCFYLRASKKEKGESIFWNPLKESFTSFSTNDVRIYSATDAYPSRDILKIWSQERLQ